MAAAAKVKAKANRIGANTSLSASDGSADIGLAKYMLSFTSVFTRCETETL
jgi:hypothetical protein